MLSLLSLLLASGTVLRADTEEWSPHTYPDPRTNHTLCNTWPNSTLCDPDHILTDQWRSEINDNIIKQIEKLRNANILYTENAPPECHENTTEGVQIYVILAKRIQTKNNQSITNAELIEFGDKLAEEYGLSDQICKNYLLLIGVEAAKMAYTRTGSSLKLPEDLMFRIYNQSENVFKEKNYMEGLNKMIDEIGDQMMDPFKYETTTSVAIQTEGTTEEITTEDPFNISSSVDLIWTETSTTQAPVKQTGNNPWWMFLCLGIAIFSTIIVLIMILISKRQTFKTLQMQTVIPVQNTTTKSNCPSDDNNSDRFATITIPRRRIDLETEIKNEEDNLQKIEIKDEEENDGSAEVTEANDNEHDYRFSESITNHNNNITIKLIEKIPVESREEVTSPQPSLPKSPICYNSLGPVQINADHLSTDIVISYLSSSSCESEEQAESTLPSPKSSSTARII